jgi:hypothetical protein
VNLKIAAPVCFISLSAPSIAMYAMTIMAQPTRQKEAEMLGSTEVTKQWHEMHRKLYLPVMHIMMFLSLVGLASSLRKLLLFPMIIGFQLFCFLTVPDSMLFNHCRMPMDSLAYLQTESLFSGSCCFHFPHIVPYQCRSSLPLRSPLLFKHGSWQSL